MVKKIKKWIEIAILVIKRITIFVNVNKDNFKQLKQDIHNKYKK